MFQPDGRIPPFRAPMPTSLAPYPTYPMPVNGGNGPIIDRRGYMRNGTSDQVLNYLTDVTNATQDAYYANSTNGGWQGPNPAGMDPNMAFYNQAIMPMLSGANRTTQAALNHSFQPREGGEGGGEGAAPKKGSLIKDSLGFGAVGAGIGACVGGPPGAAIGGAIGAVTGGIKHFLFG
jgi:hypothetical protein